MRQTGVLLGSDAEACTIPAAVIGYAQRALVIEIHAYGNEAQAKPKPEAGATLPVRVVPRAKTSIIYLIPEVTARIREGERGSS